MLFPMIRLFRSPDDLGGGASPAGAGSNPNPAELMIPKFRFDEVNTKLQAAEQKLAEQAAKEAEYSKKDERVKELEKELADTKASYAKEKSDAQRMEAIKASIGDGVQDVDVLMKLIDLDKVTMDDKGKLTGLDEQMKTLKTEKPFLFKAPPAPVKPGKDGAATPKEKSFAVKLAEKKATEKAVSKGANSYFG